MAMALPARADEDMDQISQKLKQGDFSVVKTELIPLAESGNPRAQFNLGVSYAFGNGVEKDLVKSFQWTLRAAQNNEIRAEVNVASDYYDGRGTQQNTALAISWYQKAADSGDENANLVLAKIYRDGLAGNVDYPKALQYFTRAAEKGNREAKYNLAAFYHFGLGVPQNEVRAQSIFVSLNDGKAADTGFNNPAQ